MIIHSDGTITTDRRLLKQTARGKQDPAACQFEPALVDCLEAGQIVSDRPFFMEGGEALHPGEHFAVYDDCRGWRVELRPGVFLRGLVVKEESVLQLNHQTLQSKQFGLTPAAQLKFNFSRDRSFIISSREDLILYGCFFDDLSADLLQTKV